MPENKFILKEFTLQLQGITISLFRGSSATGIADRQTDERGLLGHIFLQQKADTHPCDFFYWLYNCGAYILFVPEETDTVEPDQLYILRDLQSQPVKYLQYEIGQTVGHAENTVKGQPAVNHMFFEKLLKFFIGFIIVHNLHLIMQAPGQATVLKSGFPFVWFVVYGGAFTQESDVTAAQIGQFLGCKLSTGEVIAGHAGNAGTHTAMDMKGIFSLTLKSGL